MTRDDITAAVAASIAPLTASVAVIDERQKGIAEMLERERETTRNALLYNGAQLPSCTLVGSYVFNLWRLM